MYDIRKTYPGRIQRFWKGAVLYVGHHGWPTKKILGFRWSKKAKITLESIRFWQNISINNFKFSPFLYAMKACQWNPINFSKFANALIRKEKKHLCSRQWEKKNREKVGLYLCSRQWEKKNREKVGLCFITSCFMKSFNMTIN